MFACLQEVASSFRLFKVASSGLQIIKYFSYRHKLFYNLTTWTSDFEQAEWADNFL